MDSMNPNQHFEQRGFGGHFWTVTAERKDSHQLYPRAAVTVKPGEVWRCEAVEDGGVTYANPVEKLPEKMRVLARYYSRDGAGDSDYLIVGMELFHRSGLTSVGQSTFVDISESAPVPEFWDRSAKTSWVSVTEAQLEILRNNNSVNRFAI